MECEQFNRIMGKYLAMDPDEKINLSPSQERYLRKKYNLFDTKNAKHLGSGFSLNLMRYREKYGGDYGYEDPVFISTTDSDINYILHGSYLDLISCPEFSRLNYIKQLGMVGLCAAYGCADQTRAAHSFITAVLCDSVLTENDFNYETIKLGIASGLYHDIATTPWSDQGKRMDMKKFDEEKLVDSILRNSNEIPGILKKHNLSIEEIVSVIRGTHPVVGPLINSKQGLDLDNVAYLALDHQWINLDYPFDDIKSFTKSKSRPFDAYRNLKFIDNKWVFTNPEQVRDLLFIRALMYQRVYHNPWNRAKEAFIGKALRQMKRKKIITDKDMLKFTDIDLERTLKGKIPKKEHSSFFHPFFSCFMEKDREYDLSKFERLQKKYKNKRNISVYKFKPPRPATDTLILHNNKIASFEEVYPEQTRLIKQIVEILNYIGIYEKTKMMDYNFPSEKSPFMDEGLESICKPKVFLDEGLPGKGSFVWTAEKTKRYKN